VTAETITSTAADMAAEAARILAEVRQEPWKTREAQWAIGWQYTEAAECLEVYYCVLNDLVDPYKVHAPDMAWWDDPKRSALEFAADEALEAAKEARKLLAQYQPRERSSEGDEGR
jgi:hypothetical protein